MVATNLPLITSLKKRSFFYLKRALQTHVSTAAALEQQGKAGTSHEQHPRVSAGSQASARPFPPSTSIFLSPLLLGLGTTFDPQYSCNWGLKRGREQLPCHLPCATRTPGTHATPRKGDATEQGPCTWERDSSVLFHMPCAGDATQTPALCLVLFPGLASERQL